MKPAVAAAYRTAMSDARAAQARGEVNAAFAALERAHILGQRFLIAHIVTHLHMLRIGWTRRDRREVFGQVLRLIATIPGYLSGWVPKGNTGGANVSAIKPMALDGDMAKLLQDFSVWRDVAKRVAVYGVMAIAIVAGLAWFDGRLGAQAAALDTEWRHRPAQRIADIGSTSFLEITPIVNWRAVDGLKSEPGVAYLVRTDRYTVLFDLGFNRNGESPSPLEHNLAALGIAIEDIDAIFLSHSHRDHVGGHAWERAKTFSFGTQQRALRSDLHVLTPEPMTYPGLTVQNAQGPQAWLPGLATTGPIPRQLALGRIDEQALLIHVEGRGLVAIVGCGHQTVPKLLAHIQATFPQPLIGLVGDVHYPVPEGRLFIAGIDAQRRLASGDGVLQPIEANRVRSELDMLHAQLEFLALGAHDTSDTALAWAAERFGTRFQPMVVGQGICVRGIRAGDQQQVPFVAGECPRAPDKRLSRT